MATTCRAGQEKLVVLFLYENGHFPQKFPFCQKTFFFLLKKILDGKFLTHSQLHVFKLIYGISAKRISEKTPPKSTCQELSILKLTIFVAEI